MFDVPPVFPLPKQWHRSADSIRVGQEVAILLTNMRNIWSLQHPGDRESDCLALLDAIIRYSHHTFGQATLPTTPDPDDVSAEKGSWTNPIIHRLLSYRPLQQDSSRWFSCMQEVCRLGCLLYMVPVWRSLGVAPVESATLLKNLNNSLDVDDEKWGDLWVLKLWTLYMAAIEALDTSAPGPLQIWVLDQLTSVCLSNGVTDWNAGLALVKGILWFDCLFEMNSAQLDEKLRPRFELRDSCAR